MRTIIFDANNLFISNFLVNGSLNENGIPCGGIIGFLKQLNNIISLLKPLRLIISWDGLNGSINKRSVFKGYKEGRKPVIGSHYSFGKEEDAKKNLQWQIQSTQKIIDLLPVCQLNIDNCESDDTIAYICNNKDYYGFDSCIISSTDKDFYQLVGSKVGIYNPVTKKLITQQTILNEYNIHPQNWLFAKSICGDTSDNIDGISRIGFKTAAKLFDLKSEQITFNSDGLETYIGGFKEDKKKLFRENFELIQRNEKLMSLKDLNLSLNQKHKIDFIISNFCPILKTKDLYITIMDLGLKLNPLMFSNLSYLSKK